MQCWHILFPAWLRSSTAFSVLHSKSKLSVTNVTDKGIFENFCLGTGDTITMSSCRQRLWMSRFELIWCQSSRVEEAALVLGSLSLSFSFDTHFFISSVMLMFLLVCFGPILLESVFLLLKEELNQTKIDTSLNWSSEKKKMWFVRIHDIKSWSWVGSRY